MNDPANAEQLKGFEKFKDIELGEDGMHKNEKDLPEDIQMTEDEMKRAQEVMDKMRDITEEDFIKMTME